MVTAATETIQLARLLVSLKLTMLRASGTAQFALWVIMSILGLCLGIAGIGLLWWLRGYEHGPVVVAALSGLLLCGWTVLTVATQGGEALIDPRKFLLYPISSTRLSAGLLVAGLMTVPAIATTLLAFGMVIHARSILGALGIVVTAVAFVVCALCSGRALLRAIGHAALGRRTRNAAAFVSILFGAMAGLSGPLFASLADQVNIGHFRTIRRILRWLPFGWPGEAFANFSEDRLAAGLLPMALSIALAVALLVLWSRLTSRALTAPPPAAVSRTEGGLVPRWMLSIVEPRTAAVWSRTLRQIRRDPRELLESASMLPMFVGAMFPAFDALRSGDDRVVLGLAPLGVGLAITGFNIFGADGRSHGVDLLAMPSMGPVIRGKTLARLTIAVPILVVVTLILSAVVDGWRYSLPGMAASLCGFATMTGFGAVVSSKHPFPLPERIGAQGQGNANLATFLLRLVSMAGGLALSAPGAAAAIVAAVLAPWWVTAVACVFAVAWGYFMYRWFTGKAAAHLESHAPEVFQELSAAY